MEKIWKKRLDFFPVLGDATTLKILQVLLKKQMLCVSDIALATGKSISSISHQLRKLKDLGLVKAQRDGKMICYILVDSENLKFLQQIL